MTGLRNFDRLEAERLRRMRECFDADRPTALEVRAAMQRWHSAQTRGRRPVPVRASWVIAGAMLLSGGALAATRVAQLPIWASFTSRSKSASPEPAASNRISRYFFERGGRRIEHTQSADFKLAPGEHAALIIDETRTELVGPGLAHVQREDKSNRWVTQFAPPAAASELGAPRLPAVGRDTVPGKPASTSETPNRGAPQPNAAGSTPKPDEVALTPAFSGSRSEPASSVSSNSLDGAWSRAASAMKRGDGLAARAALAEISRSSDPAARDAAQLAQAQLDLAAGRSDRAMPLLNQLAQTGATAFIRQRAQEIIVSGR